MLENKILDNQKKEKKRSYLMDALVKGVLVLLPITIILIILGMIFDMIFNIVGPLGAIMNSGSDAPRWVFKFIAFLIFLGFILLVGMIVKNSTGRKYFRKFEKRYLQRIPLYNVFLETVTQFTGIKEMPFTQVVLVDPYNSGVLMTGFITDQNSHEIYTVFVPTAPNPSNGFVFHAKKDQLTFLDATPEQAMRTVVGMGTGTSLLFDKEKLDNAIDESKSEKN